MKCNFLVQNSFLTCILFLNGHGVLYIEISAYLEDSISAVIDDPFPTVAYSSSLVSCSSCSRSASRSSRSLSSAAGERDQENDLVGMIICRYAYLQGGSWTCAMQWTAASVNKRWIDE